MSSFKERANNAGSILAQQAIVNEAKLIVHLYALQYPTKIRVTSLMAAEQAYKIRGNDSTSDPGGFYKQYVEDLLNFADYISGLKTRELG